MYFGDLHLQKTSFYQGKTLISIKSPFRFNTNSGTHFDSVGDKFPVVFVTFSVSDPNWFPNLLFFKLLDQKYNKMAPKNNRGLTCFRHFFRPCSAGDVFESSLAHFGSLLAPFWLPFGLLLVPFGSFWVPFLDPFWTSDGALLFYCVPYTPTFRMCSLCACALGFYVYMKYLKLWVFIISC